MRPKLGKLPKTPDRRDLRLGTYLTTLPMVPAVFGFGKLYSEWGVLGNDRYGDCVFAGAGHETMIWRKARHGQDTRLDAKSVLSDYSAVTGFDASDPSSDQGTVVRDALRYRQATGIVDMNGVRHKIAAYVALRPRDWEQLVAASYIFGAVGIGFEFPDTAWKQWDTGQPWTVDNLDSPIDGGHYVPLVGTQSKEEWMACITWGKRQVMGRDFYEAYSDEAWAMLSEEQMRSDGTGLHGFDLATLQADLAAL